MTPGKIRPDIVAERAFWIRQMIDDIKTLPLQSMEEFFADKHHLAAAESYLRRCLEALLDLGRHILAKGFGYPAVEYKEVAKALGEKGVLGSDGARLMVRMAGYRNRMVHFYHEIEHSELYEICRMHLQDIEAVLDELLAWVRQNPDLRENY
jgi:uncharacterized protein YutE (UPF0331/DUF86 family)